MSSRQIRLRELKIRLDLTIYQKTTTKKSNILVATLCSVIAQLGV